MHNSSVNKRISAFIDKLQKKSAITEILVLQKDGLFYQGTSSDPLFTEILPAMSSAIMNMNIQIHDMYQLGSPWACSLQGKNQTVLMFPLSDQFFLVLLVKTPALNKQLKRYLYHQTRALSVWLHTVLSS